MDKLLKQAFTLIELLIVIAIVGILSGLIIVGMSSSVNNARIAKAQIFDGSVRDSLLMNLVSEWKFDGPTAVDSAATLNDGLDTWGSNNATGLSATVNGGSNCVSNKCLSFNGTTDYVSINNVVMNINNAAISLWANSNSDYSSNYVNQGHIIGNTNQYLNYLAFSYGSGKYEIKGETGLNSENFVSTTSLAALNQWHNLIVSFDQAIAKTYLDGILVDTRSGLTTNWTINRFALTQAVTAFQGRIDNVRIFNAPIPASNVKAQYYSELNKLLLKRIIAQNEYADRIYNLQTNLVND